MVLNWNRSTRCSSGSCVEVAWRKSTFSDSFNSCVEAGWARAAACANGSCVEVSHQHDRALLRDSKLGDASPVIAFTPAAWRTFLAVVADWDRTAIVHASGCLLTPLRYPAGGVSVSSAGIRLRFTGEEWDAFVAGVKAGEFAAEVLSG